MNDIEHDYEAGDVNSTDDDDGFDDAEGNRVEGGTPAAVLAYLARSIASEPDAVVVNSDERDGVIRLSLHVAPEDMGRVIGRRGRTAQAIRTLVGVAGARDGVQTNVDIVDV
ncbi:MAG: KH domain-containing protein [Actinobacteria bacterium]|nr:KH domain-containing protein [Actinomycetota bacterium]MCL5444633.1 KH domain-containing protein [Actinomycetota bacterium]